MKDTKETILTQEYLEALQKYNDPIVQKLLEHINYTNEKLQELFDLTYSSDISQVVSEVESLIEKIDDHDYDIDSLEDDIDSLEDDIREKEEYIDKLEEELVKYNGTILSNDHNTLPYVYLFETLNEAIYKHSPQKVENVLKMLL